MLQQKINRLPVVDEDNKVIGIVTRADIVRSMIPTENK
jgi:CBS domain-containing protein